MRHKIVLLLLLVFSLTACNLTGVQNQNPFDSEAAADQPVWLNMNKNYPETQNLEDGNGQEAKVIILIGQSNATGCSLTSYLKKNLGEEAYAKYETGFSNVRINYCLDDHKYTSRGEFVTTNLSCAAGEGYFGPEVGLAEKLAEAYPDESIFYIITGFQKGNAVLSMKLS